jgi:hypothetical protein
MPIEKYGRGRQGLAASIPSILSLRARITSRENQGVARRGYARGQTAAIGGSKSKYQRAVTPAALRLPRGPAAAE